MTKGAHRAGFKSGGGAEWDGEFWGSILEPLLTPNNLPTCIYTAMCVTENEAIFIFSNFLNFQKMKNNSNAAMHITNQTLFRFQILQLTHKCNYFNECNEMNQTKC